MFPRALFTPNPFARGPQVYSSAPSVEFLPSDISDLNLWLDANDPATLFQLINGTTPAAADSDLVGYWTDKSGSGNHAIALADNATRFALSTAAQNGKNVVLSTSGDLLNNSTLSVNTGAWSIVAVLAWRTAHVTNGGLIAFKPATGTRNDYESTGGLALGVGSSAGTPRLEIGGATAASIALAAATYAVISIQLNAGTRIVRRNGTLISSAAYTSSGVSTGYLLNGRWLSGAISASFRPNANYAEVTMYGKSISTAELNNLGGALATKWGLSWTTVT